MIQRTRDQVHHNREISQVLASQIADTTSKTACTYGYLHCCSMSDIIIYRVLLPCRACQSPAVSASGALRYRNRTQRRISVYETDLLSLAGGQWNLSWFAVTMEMVPLCGRTTASADECMRFIQVSPVKLNKQGLQFSTESSKSGDATFATAVERQRF